MASTPPERVVWCLSTIGEVTELHLLRIHSLTDVLSFGGARYVSFSASTSASATSTFSMPGPSKFPLTRSFTLPTDFFHPVYNSPRPGDSSAASSRTPSPPADETVIPSSPRRARAPWTAYVEAVLKEPEESVPSGSSHARSSWSARVEAKPGSIEFLVAPARAPSPDVSSHTADSSDPWIDTVDAVLFAAQAPRFDASDTSSSASGDVTMSTTEDESATTASSTRKRKSKGVSVRFRPPVPFQPVLRDLPPLPAFYYFVPTAHDPSSHYTAPKPPRTKRGKAARVSADEALAEQDVDDEHVPTDEPCGACRRDGVLCVPAFRTRQGQGCCVLCRASGVKCERGELKRERELLVVSVEDGCADMACVGELNETESARPRKRVRR